MEGLERFVREHPFFAGMEPAYTDLISGCAKNVRCDAGQYLFHQGDPADFFYLIRHGRMQLEINAGKDRREALQNLALRADVEDMKSFVDVLIQTDRCGATHHKPQRIKCGAAIYIQRRNNDAGGNVLNAENENIRRLDRSQRAPVHSGGGVDVRIIYINLR